LPHERLTLMGACSLVWSCRLTFNYWRRGGYQIGSEDYRWEIVRKNIPSWAFFLLNVTFISFIQSILLMLLALPPAYSLLLANQYEKGIKLSDWVPFGVELALVAIEFLSDGQQWTYQTAKYQYKKDGNITQGHNKTDLDRGFATSGLWAYSRHPNFAAEQAIWFVMYQWSCVASNVLYSWTGIGVASLILLFQSSTLLTETITAGKYPEYATYQKTVGKFLPSSLTPYKDTELARKQQVVNKDK
jgi:steroid 5-alpha reductase family enzyme